MGFGTLFLGYMFNISIFRQFTDVICALIMLYALLMLCRYNSGFRRAMYLCIALAVAGAIYFVYGLCDIFALVNFADETSSLINSYYSLLSGILKLVFTVYLLMGIQQIGKETGVPVIEMKAARNRFLTFVYYIPFIFTELYFEGGSTLAKIAAYAFLPVLVFGIVYHIMNLSLIFNCYAWICLEGEESMERKPSRFKLVNKINEYEDKIEDRIVERKREQKMQKAKKKHK